MEEMGHRGWGWVKVNSPAPLAVLCFLTAEQCDQLPHTPTPSTPNLPGPAFPTKCLPGHAFPTKCLPGHAFPTCLPAYASCPCLPGHAFQASLSPPQTSRQASGHSHEWLLHPLHLLTDKLPPLRIWKDCGCCSWFPGANPPRGKVGSRLLPLPTGKRFIPIYKAAQLCAIIP